MTYEAAIEEITTILIERDVDAFCQGDWSAVEPDFDADAFVGYAGTDEAGWSLRYPQLSVYRDDWLTQSADLRARSTAGLRDELASAQRLTSIEVQGDRALVRKTFDGSISLADGGEQRLDWETYYMLRCVDAGWRITGFVGYLPRRVADPPTGSPRIEAPPSGQHRTAGPYRPVLSVAPGRLVVLSGQGPLDDEGRLVGDSVAAQTVATLANCERQLAAAGAGLSDVFKVNAYLADLADWPEFNAAYESVMPPGLPVRTAVGVSLLLGMRVELEMWAAP